MNFVIKPEYAVDQGWHLILITWAHMGIFLTFVQLRNTLFLSAEHICSPPFVFFTNIISIENISNSWQLASISFKAHRVTVKCEQMVTLSCYPGLAQAPLKSRAPFSQKRMWTLIFMVSNEFKWHCSLASRTESTLQSPIKQLKRDVVSMHYIISIYWTSWPLTVLLSNEPLIVSVLDL